MVAQFLIADGYIQTGKESVTRRQDQTNWYIQFCGDKGREAFEHWLEQCRTDPVFRKALKTL